MAEIRDYSNNPDPQTSARWPEGMAMASVNDTGRVDEGILGRWEKDVNGSLVSNGTSTAYTVTPNRDLVSNQATPIYDGLEIAFKPHVDSGDNPTLNVQSTGAINIVDQYGQQITAGALKQNTPTKVMYSSQLSAYVAYTTIDSGLYVPRRQSAGGSPDYAKGSADIPAGTVAERPTSAPVGSHRYNSETGALEYWVADSDGGGTPGWLRDVVQTSVANEITVNQVSLSNQPWRFGFVPQTDTQKGGELIWRFVPSGGSVNTSWCSVWGRDDPDFTDSAKWAVRMRIGGAENDEYLLLNEKGLAVAGNSVVVQNSPAYESATQAVSIGGITTFSHGLGYKPRLYAVFLENQTADGNWQPGDEVDFGTVCATRDSFNDSDSAISCLYVDNDTSIKIRWSDSHVALPDKTTGVYFKITPASWLCRARAWA